MDYSTPPRWFTPDAFICECPSKENDRLEFGICYKSSVITTAVLAAGKKEPRWPYCPSCSKIAPATPAGDEQEKGVLHVPDMEKENHLCAVGACLALVDEHRSELVAPYPVKEEAITLITDMVNRWVVDGIDPRETLGCGLCSCGSPTCTYPGSLHCRNTEYR